MEHQVVGKLRAQAAAWRYKNPARSLKVIAVAGAYGKTTTATLLGEMLQEAGYSVMTLTNHGCSLNGQPINRRYGHSADALQHCLSEARKKEVNYVIIEVTEELIATHVLPTLILMMSVITSDSPLAQALLSEPVDYAVVPSGFDVAGLSVAPHQAINFGESDLAEAQIVKITERRMGTEVDMVIDHQTKLSVATYLIGQANALNVAAAVSAAYVLAADMTTFDEGVARLERIAGNYDYIPSGDAPYGVAVDAASNEQSLKLVLASAAKLKKRRLLVVADSSVSNEFYPLIKQSSDRVITVGESAELPGVEQAADKKAALELVKRGAKKDDLILLVGREFAQLQSNGDTLAHQMVEATDE
jgi:UDP-N-acetylmuramyl tripeptide synthase